MSGFHEINFPADISSKAVSKNNFVTEVIRLAGGNEKRNILQQFPIKEFEINLKEISNQQAERIINFFIARKGRAYSFRFKDWQDFQTKNQEIGVGNGTQTQFQMVKKYGDEISKISRKITKPIAESTKIYLGGELQSSNYSVGINDGIINFSTPPANNIVITADFEFDTQVRFSEDNIGFSQESFGKGAMTKIKLIEVV